MKNQFLKLLIKVKKVLLHSCCVPCAGEVMEAMAASSLEVTIYFYNPNIHPKEEYMIRKEENKRFAEKNPCFALTWYNNL